MSTTTTTARQAKRWTDSEIAQLRQRVARCATAKAGIELHARASGRTIGTVQQKFYAVQRANTAKAKTTALAATPSVDLLTTIRDATAELERRLAKLASDVRAMHTGS